MSDAAVKMSAVMKSPPRRPGRPPQTFLATPEVPGWHHLDFDDGVGVHFRDPGWSFEDARLAAHRRASQARDETQSLTASLVGLLEQTNALGVYLRLVTEEQLSRSRRTLEMAGYEGAVEFLGGLLTSMDPELVAANMSVPLPTEVVREIEALLRGIASLAPLITAVDLDGHPDERHLEERYQLLLERMYVRMAGYPQHLRVINRTIMSEIGDVSMDVLGFRPVRVLELAERHTTVIEEVRMREVARLREDHGHSPPLQRREALVQAFAEAAAQDPAAIATEAGDWSPAEVAVILSALATPVGSQGVTSLLSPNRLRQFPVVQLADGRHVWPHPEDFEHEALEWFDVHLVERSADNLREQLSKRRARATEQLVADRLASIFGADRVTRGAVYSIGANRIAETDVIVDLPGAAIVVEAKAHRVTPPARAGHAGRVRTKFKELVEAPVAQTARAREALLAGEKFTNAKGTAAIRPGQCTEVARVVITLDRIDPFAVLAKDGDAGGPGDVWMVSLADFLAVTDVLQDPTATYAYLRTRMAQTAAQSPHIASESDALGAWLRSREGVWPLLAGSAGTLSYSSEQVNEYFTKADQHERWPDLIEAPPRPSLAVPQPVLDLMRRELDKGHPLWPSAAMAIFDVHPKGWRPILRDLETPVRARTRNQRRAAKRAADGRGLTDALHVALVEPPTPEFLGTTEGGPVRVQVHRRAQVK